MFSCEDEAKTGSTTSPSVLLYVHKDHKDYYGRGAQDVHLDFHTVFKKFCLTSDDDNSDDDDDVGVGFNVLRCRADILVTNGLTSGW